MKLNLGCGHRKKEEFVNVDNWPECKPDVLLDLENEKWPWPNDSISEIHMDHVLEHLGETKDKYFHVIRELYRVLQPNGVVKIRVPHPRHDNFIIDCTHVRPILPEGLTMFSVKKNLKTIADNGAESCLGLQLKVDFEVTDVKYLLASDVHEALGRGQLNDFQVRELLRTQNNICEEIHIEIIAIKK